MSDRNKRMATDKVWRDSNLKVAEMNRNNPEFQSKVAEKNRLIVKTESWKAAHKDGVKKRSNNLEWRNKISIARSGKDIEQIDIFTGQAIAVFIGPSMAERETGIKRQHIVCCLKGRRKTCGGYGWRYRQQ